MYGTQTRSNTSTYTEARARYVNDKVYDDTQAMAIRKLITYSKAQKWREDILYILNKQSMDYFQFQFTFPDGTKKALQYNLKDDGNIYANDDSGGINYWSIPSGTNVILHVSLNTSSTNYHEVNQKLTDDGWGTGNAVTGTSSAGISYSKDGYGLKRNQINW